MHHSKSLFLKKIESIKLKRKPVFGYQLDELKLFKKRAITINLFLSEQNHKHTKKKSFPLISFFFVSQFCSRQFLLNIHN
jgi:hypothetical protein